MLAPGTLLQNRYEIQRLIAEGGMGAVYLARDRRLDSEVALKETLFTDQRMSKAFEREARLLARLRHPALPRVSDHFIEENGQFLVMEYIPGEDLAQIMKRRAAPFPCDDVMRWADQLLDALDYLHSQEHPIIHRDIKPQNIKLTAQRDVILLDFGLAKSVTQMTRLTTVGSIYGYTPGYAPLEQIQGAGTDPRSDLYSLGATIYHLITGTKPKDALARAASLIGGSPDPLRSPEELSAELPANVASVLMRVLEQDRDRRYGSASELRAALQVANQEVGRYAQIPRDHSPSETQLYAATEMAPTDQPEPGYSAPVQTVKRGASRAGRPTHQKRRLIYGVAIVLLIIALSVVATKRSHWTKSTPSTEGRMMSYYLTVWKKDQTKPVRIASELTLEGGDRLQLHFLSRQSGYIYLLNEARAQFVLLLSGLVDANSEVLVPNGYGVLEFDTEKGNEILWLCWSSYKLDALELLKASSVSTANSKNVHQFLASNSLPEVNVERDEGKKETILKTTGDVLVYQIALAHE